VSDIRGKRVKAFEEKYKPTFRKVLRDVSIVKDAE
jgi:hypothetical protein